MDELGGTLEREDPRSHPVRSLATIAAVGVILILGAGAGYFLAHAGPEALAVTSWALITTGLVGLIVMISVASFRQPLTGDDHHRGYGRGDDPPPEPGPASGMDGLDAELLRILDDARLGDISIARRSPGREHRAGTA